MFFLHPPTSAPGQPLKSIVGRQIIDSYLVSSLLFVQVIFHMKSNSFIFDWLIHSHVNRPCFKLLIVNYMWT